MANVNSNIVANRFTSPITPNHVGQDGGRKRIVGGNFEVGSGDITTNNDTIRLAFLPANARLWGLYVGGDTLDSGSSLVMDIGLFDPGTASTAPGTANDQNIFVSGATIFQTATDPGLNNLLGQSGLASFLANWGERLWEVAGDTEGDFKEYEIVMTATTAPGTDVAGTITWWIEYTID